MSLKSKQLMLLSSWFGGMLPDSLYLKWEYRLHLGKSLNLRHPRTFNEKLQWLKLHDRNPQYSVMVDKYAVKEYVSNLIGPQYIVPLLGLWDRAEDIDFNTLPDSFVLKCTHNSGGVFVVRDKSSVNLESIRSLLAEGLSENFYSKAREWPYKDVRPRIIAEHCLPGEIRDYKFFCFSGKPEYMFIATDREASDRETCFDFFDMDYNHIAVTNGHPNAAAVPLKPDCWELMKSLATRLSEGMPHVRVDFYEVDGKVYFGEYTFYHWGGMVPFVPDDLDWTMGALITEKRSSF